MAVSICFFLISSTEGRFHGSPLLRKEGVPRKEKATTSQPGTFYGAGAPCSNGEGGGLGVGGGGPYSEAKWDRPKHGDGGSSAAACGPAPKGLGVMVIAQANATLGAEKAGGSLGGNAGAGL